MAIRPCQRTSPRQIRCKLTHWRICWHVKHSLPLYEIKKMKFRILIALLLLTFNNSVYSQSNDDVSGIWNVTFRGYLYCDTLFYVDSLGNRTDQIYEIDTIAFLSRKFNPSTWNFINNKLTITQKNESGKIETKNFKYKFLESGLLISSKNEQFKYYIEEIRNDKLVLFNDEHDPKSPRIELTKIK